MFFKKKTPAQTNLQEQIDNAQTQLDSTDVLSPEYDKILNTLEKLYKLQSLDKTGFKVSPDAVVAAAASILGIIIIVAYEHAHTITSKSISFVPKTKI